MSDFREPWIRNLTHIIGEDGEVIAVFNLHPELADRIIACVNFCRNVPIETLRFYGAPLKDEKVDHCPAKEWAQSIAHD